MVTLFSVPKNFIGSTKIIQDNAIGSWSRLGSGCDIVLFGNDPGVAEAAERHKTRHEPFTRRNELGTPLVSNVFHRMNILARHPIVAFVNSDIILLDDFLPAIDAVARCHEKFLIVTSRFNCRIDHPFSFESGWAGELRQRARSENRMYPAAGSDIFVFPRGLLLEVPPFAIGRGYWDNWLMREARRTNADLIDVTAAVTAVHQMHSYSTVSGLPAESSMDAQVYDTDEGRHNLELAGGPSRLYTVFDATKIMGEDRRLRSCWNPGLIRRRVKASLRRILNSYS
jgi:hypothetical protein